MKLPPPAGGVNLWPAFCEVSGSFSGPSTTFPTEASFLWSCGAFFRFMPPFISLNKSAIPGLGTGRAEGGGGPGGGGGGGGGGGAGTPARIPSSFEGLFDLPLASVSDLSTE